MNGSDEIVARLMHDQALFDEASALHRGKGLIRQLFLMAAVLAALAYVFLSLSGVSMSGEVKLTFAAAWMGFGFLYLYTEWIREMAARRRFLRSPDFQKSVEYRISENQVSIRAADASPAWDWRSFSKAIIGKTGILLYLNRSMYLPLLRRGFKNEGDFVAARDLVKRSVSNCVERARPIAAVPVPAGP